MIEKRRESPDQGGAYGALLTDLSKTSGYLSHELIIAKLYTYGVNMSASCRHGVQSFSNSGGRFLESPIHFLKATSGWASLL